MARSSVLVVLSVVTVFSLQGCDFDSETDPRGPQPFAPQERVKTRQASMATVLNVLIAGTPAQTGTAIEELAGWRQGDLELEWARLEPALVEACRSGRVVVDRRVVESLTRIGPRTASVISYGLRSADGEVVQQAAAHLANSGDRGQRLLIASLGEGTAYSSKLDGVALDGLAKRLKDSDPKQRSKVAELLWHLALTIERRQEANALGALAAPGYLRAVELLGKLLEDHEPSVRVTGLEALAHLGPGAKSVVPQVAELMRDPVPEVAQVAGSVIHKFGPGSLEIVSPLLLSQEVGLRQAAVSALGKIGAQSEPEGESAAAQALVKLVDDPDSEVRIEVYRALARLRRDPEAERVLVQALSDENLRLRRDAARLLGERPPTASVVAALSSVLSQPDEGTTLAALRSLLGFGEQAQPAREELKQACLVGSNPVRRLALEALIEIKSWSVDLFDVFIKMLNDPNEEARLIAVRQLILSGPTLMAFNRAKKEKVQALYNQLRLAASEDPDARVRKAAVNAILAVQRMMHPERQAPEPRAPWGMDDGQEAGSKGSHVHGSSCGHDHDHGHAEPGDEGDEAKGHGKDGTEGAGKQE